MKWNDIYPITSRGDSYTNRIKPERKIEFWQNDPIYSVVTTSKEARI
jgi:hypothetical protein